MHITDKFATVPQEFKENVAKNTREVAPRMRDNSDISPEVQKIYSHLTRTFKNSEDLKTHLLKVLKDPSTFKRGVIFSLESANKSSISCFHLSVDAKGQGTGLNHITLTDEPASGDDDTLSSVKKIVGQDVPVTTTVLGLASNPEEARVCVALLQHKIIDEGKAPTEAVAELKTMGKRGLQAEMRKLGLIPAHPTTNVPASAAQIQAAATETLSSLTNILGSLGIELTPSQQDLLKSDPELAAQLLSAINNPGLTETQKNEFLKQLNQAKSIESLKKIALMFMQKVPVTAEATKSKEQRRS
ncbi:MAG: hypothetical protein WCK49_10080 [Myxococcaceae bacterium]